MIPEEPPFTAAASLGPYDETAVLRAFFDNAQAFFAIKDAAGRYVYVNRFVAEAQQRADQIGKTLHDLGISSDVAQQSRKRELEVLQSGTPMQTREVFSSADGKVLSTSLLRFPIDTPSERLLAIIGLDVTELAREQGRQAALLDLATDAIHVRDMAGRITYWNRAAEALYGWSSAETNGRNALEILFPPDGKSTGLLPAIQEEFLRDGAWSGEMKKVTRGGGEVIVESRWTLLRDYAGLPDAVLVIDSDVTQKKQLQQQLSRAVRLDTIGSLAGSVAHDLNNMLMPILMGAAVLRRHVTDANLAPTLDHLEESAKKAADLVGQILTFIRGSADTKKVIAAEDLLAELQHFLSATFPPTLRIESRCWENLWPVLCQPAEIHQVLVNLSVNARDAMGEKGTLHVELQNAVVDSAYARMSAFPVTPGHYLAIAITDTGAGIRADHLGMIFDPYFTTKETGKGTGLGLSNAAAVVQEHCGFIAVDSEPGKRTTFTVFLPSAVDGVPAADESSHPVPAGAGETILVVDDERAVVQVVRETLEAFDYRVVTAFDGSEAITVLATQSPAVRIIVTDASMPIVDGIALAKFVRRAHPDVKLIIASGSNDPKRREAAEHADAYLKKPYTADTLLRLVADLLRGQVTE
jgi:PAS domain S-box-containing protein